jgi:hypothetical protein
MSVFCEPLFPNRISSSRCVAFEPWAELYPRSLSMRQDLSHISMKRARRTMICEWSRSVSTPQSVNEAGRSAGVWFADKGRERSPTIWEQHSLRGPISETTAPSAPPCCLLVLNFYLSRGALSVAQVASFQPHLRFRRHAKFFLLVYLFKIFASRWVGREKKKLAAASWLFAAY